MSRSAGTASTSLALAICVPALNEAAHLPRLFNALERLVVPRSTTVNICLLLDSCTDGSAAIASAYASRSRHEVKVAAIKGTVANAGIARHAAMASGMAVLGATGGILLSTDADSCPRADWLEATIIALAGSDLVAGDVIRNGRHREREQDRVDRYFGDLHALRRRVDPVVWEAPETHHHTSGANMAMRVETYAAMGGFPPLASGEDARFVDDAARAGLRIRRDAASAVYTSSRRSGRAEGGLATALRTLDRIGLDGVCVTDPVDQLWQYRHQALARQAYLTGDLASFGVAIRLSTDHLRGVARDCPNAEAFAMRVVPEAPGGMRQVPLPAAELALARLASDATPKQAA